MEERVRRERRDGVLRVVLNRPEKRNAFDRRTLEELLRAFQGAAEEPGIRVVVLAGEGKAFCAGADLDWMRRVVEQDFQANLAGASLLADLLQTIAELPKPVVASVQGAAIGGGLGLVAACDLAVAAEDALFSLSETRLGLVPAVIGPYVVRRIGESWARALMLTGERIDGRRARELGLVHRVAPSADLEDATAEVTRWIQAGGPGALAAAKGLLREIRDLQGDALREHTVRTIAGLRISPEGQEGMRAFLDRRKPSWRAGPEDSR